MQVLAHLHVESLVRSENSQVSDLAFVLWADDMSRLCTWKKGEGCYVSAYGDA